MLILYKTEAAHYVTYEKKTYIYKIYDFTKDVIKILDQRMDSLTCKQKTRKWTLVPLAYVPDMS